MTKKSLTAQEGSKVALFKGEEIRREYLDGEWYYVIKDIIKVLTDSTNPKGYIKDIRRRDAEISKGWGQIATPLPFNTSGGRQSINCASAEGILRIVQSVPSKKAKPFKKWLARVGKERLDEIEQQTGKKVVTHENAAELLSPEILKELVQKSLPKDTDTGI